ncbi:hypothetical protein IF2G_01476 [Cordyceps javanica]|nr:hypothetical protein IF2G_01476 [Cordyceps javanica]
MQRVRRTKVLEPSARGMAAVKLGWPGHCSADASGQQLLQDAHRPRGHCRAQERYPAPGYVEERGPVPQHQA